MALLSLYGYDNRSLNDALSVYRLDRTDYIQVDFVSEHPELSAYAANTLFEQFVRYYRQVRSVNSQVSIDTLRSIMEKKKEELDIKNAMLRNLGYVDVESGTTSTLDIVGTLEDKLQDAKQRLSEQQSDLRKIDQRIAAATTSNESGSIGSENNNEEVISARKALREAYDAYLQNPSDITLKTRYQTLRAEYNRLYVQSDNSATPSTRNPVDLASLKASRKDIEIDMQASRATIGELQGKINRLRGEATAITSQGESVETLKKERDLANKEYLDAKEKYSDATYYNGSSVNNYRQVVAAQPAMEPEPSKRQMIVGLSGIAAAITVLLVILLLTYLDSSIKTPFIFQRTVGLKLISMVNFMDLKKQKLIDIVAKKEGTNNLYDRNKFNSFRESIRKLRYEVEKTGKKVFLFTSTKKGQGKTTLIMALSYSLSLSRKKILIIDTNFCNPDLTVQMNAEPVLEKMMPYKTDGKALVEQVKVFSKEVSEGYIHVIGSEGGDYTPSEVLPRENLLQHLKLLTAEFDYIFLEGPPLNDFSDSRELADYVDGVIAIFSAQQIIKQIDKQSINFYKELNGKFCGAVLNMVDLENVNIS